jgi:beta-galactosidase
VLKRAVEEAGLNGPDQQEPATVHVAHGVNRMGKRVHYYFNYSADAVKAPYAYAAGLNLLDNKAAPKGESLELAPWDLAIIEER